MRVKVTSMLRFDLIQNQWLILALLGGTVLTMTVVLAFLALWTAGRRDSERMDDDTAEGKGVPWVLIFTYAATVVFALVYVLRRAWAPPNW